MRITTDERIKIAVQKSGRLTEHSLELLVRCGLSYSRGKDQLICYGENMPVDVLLVRDDDIPRLVQEDICDLGIVGLNVIEERRLELLEQGERRCSARSAGSTSATAACRSACRRASLRRPGVAARQEDRDELSADRRGVPRSPRDRGASRDVLGRRRDRAEPRQGRPHLRPRLERLDVARASALRGRDDSRKPRRADPDAESLAARRPNGCSGCCNEFRACCRSRRASTSCCTRRVRR